MIEIIRPGLQTTVQDQGRSGCERLGIPRGGAADWQAFAWANRLVGNTPTVAALEFLLAGPSLRFVRETFAATTGVQVPVLDGRTLDPWSSFLVPAGATLSCENLCGARGYVAIYGGIDVPIVLGARATDLESRFGGFEGRALRAGDVLHVARPEEPGSLRPRRHVPPPIDRPLTLRVVAGPRFDDFSSSAFAGFISSRYVMSRQSNHVGIRLDGPKIQSNSRGDRMSEPMPVGGIQITPAGQPVILLKARGTMGGYPVIATVITPDVWRAAQLRPGDEVLFREISLDQSQVITLQAYEDLEREPDYD